MIHHRQCGEGEVEHPSPRKHGQRHVPKESQGLEFHGLNALLYQETRQSEHCEEIGESTEDKEPRGILEGGGVMIGKAEGVEVWHPCERCHRLDAAVSRERHDDEVNSLC